MKKLLEPAAKDRKAEGQKKGGKTAGQGRAKPAENSLGANWPTSKKRASDDAAKSLNVGRKSVERAATVIANGSPELVAAVDRGEVAVSRAAEIKLRAERKCGELLAAVNRAADPLNRLAISRRPWHIGGVGTPPTGLRNPPWEQSDVS